MRRHRAERRGFGVPAFWRHLFRWKKVVDSVEENEAQTLELENQNLPPPDRVRK